MRRRTLALHGEDALQADPHGAADRREERPVVGRIWQLAFLLPEDQEAEQLTRHATHRHQQAGLCGGEPAAFRHAKPLHDSAATVIYRERHVAPFHQLREGRCPQERRQVTVLGVERILAGHEDVRLRRMQRVGDRRRHRLGQARQGGGVPGRVVNPISVLSRRMFAEEGPVEGQHVGAGDGAAHRDGKGRGTLPSGRCEC
jgi:hypothetical protein